MEIVEIDEKLKSLSEETGRQTWSLLDTSGHPTYGLNFTKIAQIAKELGKDSCLADELYASSNHDLQVLATYIDNPDSYTRDELNKRVDQLYLSPFAEKFCKLILARSPYAVHFIDQWMEIEEPTKLCYAYYTLEALANSKNNLSDEFYAVQIEYIKQEIQEQPDALKEAMHEALLAIGCRNPHLQKLASKAVAKLGEVSFNGGSRLATAAAFEKKLQSRKALN